MINRLFTRSFILSIYGFALAASLSFAGENWSELRQIDPSDFLPKVGVRPVRSNGIRVEIDQEEFPSHTLIHNYGHGGSGWTLSWGSAAYVKKLLNERIEAENKDNKKENTVAVIGTGIVGLTTAYSLLLDGWKVRLYGDDFFPATSHAAAGLISVFSVGDDPDKERSTFIERESFKRWDTLSKRTSQLGRHVFRRWLYRLNFLDEYRLGEEEDIAGGVTIPNGSNVPATKTRVNIVDIEFFFPALQKSIIRKGGQFSLRRFKDKEEIERLSESIIINCTGYRSKQLFDDPYLRPVSGHTIQIAKPKELEHWDKFFSIRTAEGKYLFFIAPWKNTFILGSTEHPDEVIEVPQMETVQTLLDDFAKFIGNE